MVSIKDPAGWFKKKQKQQQQYQSAHPHQTHFTSSTSMMMVSPSASTSPPSSAISPAGATSFEHVMPSEPQAASAAFYVYRKDSTINSGNISAQINTPTCTPAPPLPHAPTFTSSSLPSLLYHQPRMLGTRNKPNSHSSLPTFQPYPQDEFPPPTLPLWAEARDRRDSNASKNGATCANPGGDDIFMTMTMSNAKIPPQPPTSIQFSRSASALVHQAKEDTVQGVGVSCSQHQWQHQQLQFQQHQMQAQDKAMTRVGPPLKSCNKVYKNFPARYNSSTDSVVVVETQAQGYARKIKALWRRLEDEKLSSSARKSSSCPSDPSSYLSTAPLFLSNSGAYSQTSAAVHPVRHTYTSFPVQQYPPRSHLTRLPLSSEGNSNTIEAHEKSTIENRIRHGSCSQRPSLPPSPPASLPTTTNATTTPSATDNTNTSHWSGPIRTPTNAWSTRAQNTTTALQQQQQQYTDFPEYEPPSWTWGRPSPSPPPSVPPPHAPTPVLSLCQQHRQRKVASAVFTEDDVDRVVGDHGHQGDAYDIEHNNGQCHNNSNDDAEKYNEDEDEDEDDEEEDQELKRRELEALEKELAILGLQRYQYSESHENLQRQLHQQLLQEQQEQQQQEQQQYQQQYQRQQQYQEIQQQRQQQRQRELQNYKLQSWLRQNAVAVAVGGQEGYDDAAIMGVARKVSLRHERSLHTQRHRSMITTFPGMSPTKSEFIPKVPTFAK